MDDEEIELMINDCKNRGQKLSDWEFSFIDSISHFHDNNVGLTDKQYEKLVRVWERVT